MEVTLYIEEEKVGLISNPDEWLAKVTELGLEKQVALMMDEGKRANPFLRMDKGLRNVFETLCPRHIDIAAYSTEPIPYQALGMYGLATKEGYFGKIQIWDNEQNPDPAMVGVIEAEHSWDNQYFLMAQWGLEKMTMPQLIEKAKRLWIAKSIVKCKQKIAEYSETPGLYGRASRDADAWRIYGVVRDEPVP